MFHKASTKLTALYLAIIMAISLFFSINVYQLSLQEFDRGFRGQGAIIQRRPDFAPGPAPRKELLREQQLRYTEAKDRILARLVFINILILVGGGFLSYYLARRTIQPIEEAHEVLERFTADASHELRTPIAAMQTENEVALMNPKLTLKQAKDQLKSNLEELAKLTLLTDGLLRLARLGNHTLPSQKLAARAVIDKAVSRAMPLAEKKNILIHSDKTEDAKLFGDEASLVEALVIVLDNAIKYSSEKTEVVLSANKYQHGYIITVQDQGIGIKATELTHIFDRFYRADTARSKYDTNGYGLGLAIAKNIIEMHGGNITAASEDGSGSTFSISLPVSS